MKTIAQWLEQLLGSSRGRRLLAGVPAASVALFTSTAFAAGGGSSDLNWWTWQSSPPPLGWFAVNFAIFLFVLVRLTKGPLAASFKKRHETVKNAIEEAQSAHKKALAHHEEYRDKLANVEEEIESRLKNAEEDGMAERDRIIKAAEDYAERARSDAGASIDQEVDNSRRRLHEEFTSGVVDAASKTLHKELGSDDHQRLIESAIDDLSDETLSRPRQMGSMEARV